MLCLNIKRGICTAVFIFLYTSFGSSVGYNIEHKYSTSVATMTSFLETERILIEIIEEKYMYLKKKLDILNTFLADIHIKHKQSEKDPEAYLSNPLNSFPLIRRTHESWPRIVKYLQESHTSVKSINVLNRVKLPTRADLSEAAAGVELIRSIYDIKPEDIAKGYINGVQLNSKLSAFNLFTIGFELFKLKKYDTALLWLNASLQTSDERQQLGKFSTFDPAKTHTLFIRTLLKLERSDEAELAAKKALSLFPESDIIIQMSEAILQTNFERYCPEGYLQRSKSLSCRYNATTHPYYILAPSRMEEMCIDPFIVVYHDVLTDEEINCIMNSTRKKLSKNEDVDNNQMTHEADILLQSRTIKKIASLTGLVSTDFETSFVKLGNSWAELHQPQKDSKKAGERVATILIYLTDGEKGGAVPKQAVFPKKGSLLLRYL